MGAYNNGLRLDSHGRRKNDPRDDKVGAVLRFPKEAVVLPIALHPFVTARGFRILKPRGGPREEAHFASVATRRREARVFSCRGDPAKGRREARVFSCRGDLVFPVLLKEENTRLLRKRKDDLATTSSDCFTKRECEVPNDNQEKRKSDLGNDPPFAIPADLPSCHSCTIPTSSFPHVSLTSSFPRVSSGNPTLSSFLHVSRRNLSKTPAEKLPG